MSFHEDEHLNSATIFLFYLMHLFDALISCTYMQHYFQNLVKNMAIVRRVHCATACTVSGLCARATHCQQAPAFSALLLLCARSLVHVRVFRVEGAVHTWNVFAASLSLAPCYYSKHLSLVLSINHML